MIVNIITFYSRTLITIQTIGTIIIITVFSRLIAIWFMNIINFVLFVFCFLGDDR